MVNLQSSILILDQSISRELYSQTKCVYIKLEIRDLKRQGRCVHNNNNLLLFTILLAEIILMPMVYQAQLQQLVPNHMFRIFGTLVKLTMRMLGSILSTGRILIKHLVYHLDNMTTLRQKEEKMEYFGILIWESIHGLFLSKILATEILTCKTMEESQSKP